MGSLAKVFYSPKELFQKVDESPRWVMPFLVVVILTLVITAVLTPTVIQPSVLEGMRSRLEGSEEQLEGPLKFMSGPRLFIVTMVSVLVVTPVRMLAQAGVFALFLLFLRGEVNFRKILGVTAYSNVIGVVGGVVKLPLMLAKKSVEVWTNLNLFFPLAKDTFLFRFFSRIDFFTIWSLLIFALGLSMVGKVERKKGYILVFSLWLVAVVLLSLFGKFRARFGG